MANQPGNLLDRDAGIGEQRDEAVPQLTWRPVSRIQARRLGDLAEGAPDVRGVSGRSQLAVTGPNNSILVSSLWSKT